MVSSCASIRFFESNNIFNIRLTYKKSNFDFKNNLWYHREKNMYKRKEEENLSKKIISSGLITPEELLYIKNLYCESVPYHNFIHALKVSESVLMLPMQDFDIVEIKSLFVAALFHDSWHRGIAGSLDEFRSLDMAFEGILEFEKKYNFKGIDFSIIRKAIVGTVFKNRAKNTDKYATLLADLDIWTLGMNFLEYVFYADFPMMHELWFENLDAWLREVGYFKFILSVDSNIYRTSYWKMLFPNAHKNIKLYLDKQRLGDISIMYKVWKESDSYDVFYNILEKKLNYITDYL